MNAKGNIAVCDGMTLVEASIAMALLTLMCAGLYAVGLKSLKFAENDRLATEARAAAKQRVEEAMAAGKSSLALGGCVCLRATTNTSTRGYPMVLRPTIVWHAADGTVTQAEIAAYAEVQVDVTYRSLLSNRDVTDTYPMIVSE